MTSPQPPGEGRSPVPAEAAGLAPGRARLAGRRVVVVGAGTRASADAQAPVGNGRAISILATREGATVACVDIDADAADDTLSQIAAAGGNACAIVADVTDERPCERLAADAASSLGGIDGLVLNVGVLGETGLAGTRPEAWDRTLAVNLRSQFLVCRTMLPRLSDGGAVVFVGSIAGQRPGSFMPAYDASKAGAHALCRHVAQEGAPRGVRANAVVPGLIDTPLGRVTSKGRPDRAVTPIPLGRQGTAWEIAYATIFLLSQEASYVTAQELVVDGGLTVLAPRLT